MSIQIEDLFTQNRFPTGSTLLILIIYAPFGILLSIIRVFIFLQLCLASVLLPPGTVARKFVLRVLYFVMGVIVCEDNSPKENKDCRLVLSNHVTPLDHLAISLVFPCLAVNVFNLPHSLNSILCFHNISPSENRETVSSKIQSYLTKPNSLPLLIFPERASTNGRTALMKYSSWALDIDKSVMVIALKVQRLRLLPIAPSVLGSSWLGDLFFLLFSPATIYSVKYVGKMSKESSESPDDFASRIQQATASALNIETSTYTYSDKVEFMKRLIRESTAISNPLFCPEVTALASQVQEVLPHVPLNVIKEDIARTRNVDLTITNFIEGNVNYEALPSAVSATSVMASDHSNAHRNNSVSTSLASTAQDSYNVSNLNTAAKTFGKNATERMESFERRKALLIEKARHRYFQVYEFPPKNEGENPES